MSEQCKKIESAIISAAMSALSELRQFASYPDTTENRVSVTGQFHMAMGLVQLGHLADSGLSDDAIGELLRIENEADEVFVKLVERTVCSVARG